MISGAAEVEPSTGSGRLSMSNTSHIRYRRGVYPGHRLLGCRSVKTAAFYLTEILLVRRTSHLPSEDGLRSEMADMSAAHDTCTGQSLSTESALRASAWLRIRRTLTLRNGHCPSLPLSPGRPLR